MSSAIVSMPGKIGDLLFSLQIVREIVDLYGAPVTLVTTPYCEPAAALVLRQSALVAEVFIDKGYQPTADDPGMQPWHLDIPRQSPHRDIIQLGLRRHPWPGENIADAIGFPFGMKARPGPWLVPARVDPAGHSVFSAPVTDVTIAPLMDTWRTRLLATASIGRRCIVAGSPAELQVYESIGLQHVPGIELRACADLADFADVLDGAANFFGVASSPAVVAAGMGLPCEWMMRPGSDERWLPKGCDVRVVAPGQVMRPRLVAVGGR